MLLNKLVIAFSLMFLCTLIHTAFMSASNQTLDKHLAQIGNAKRPFYRAVLIWLMIQWMFVAICIEASLWALTYMLHPEITVLPDAISAFYFSMVTYTSLGYGDIVLSGDWRALAAIQAANGIIIFGWTTALIFYFIQKIYKPH